ncbi:MAG: hypothetical protein C0508_29700 [Cyanobacteria bacterium PR.023]|nr:hypothetical protein [Cyanobacteria bacterium PR.023]
MSMNINETVIHWILTAIVLGATLALSIAALKNRRGKGAYLCDDCRFNNSEKCLKPVRPYAVECTSYRPNLKQS